MSDQHLAQVLAIEHSVHLSPWTREQFCAALQNTACQAWVLLSGLSSLSRVGERFDAKAPSVVAYALVQVVLDEAELLNIAVDSSYQRQGHGSQLLSALLQRLSAQGVRQIGLEVRQSNVAAQMAYTNVGFQTIALRKGYYSAAQGREDARVMRCVL